MSFGYSGNKEDVSMKLRAQNMKNARKQTSQLEIDNRKMEERLQELKLAMMHEKEERDMNHGGGFWQTGKEGNLGDYAKEVLNRPNKPEKKKEKKKKVTVLKDEPIVTPERSKGPGSMKYLADRPSGKENKIKGPVCGQCEQKGAHVSCLECGEDYCASCFAAFHMRGALKKHRSVPVTGSRTPRAMATMSGEPKTKVVPRSPPYDEALRATPTDVSLIMDSSRSSARSSARSMSSAKAISESSNGMVHRPQPPAQPAANPRTQVSPPTNSQATLLEGDYDEREAAAEFQRALAEWRTGKKTAVNNSGQEQKKVVASPVRTPGYSADEGTGTETLEQAPVDIQFHGTLTYAEKLMLKKHRRHQLGPAPSSNSSDSSSYQGESSASSRIGSGQRAGYSFTGMEYSEQEERPSIFSDIEVINQHAIDAELAASRVDFGSLLSAVKRPYGEEQMEEPDRSESRVSIIEINDVARRSLRGLEQTAEYEGTELEDGELFRPPTPSSLATAQRPIKEAFRTPQSSAKLPRTRQGASKSNNSPIQSQAEFQISTSQSYKDNSNDNEKSPLKKNVRKSKGAMDISDEPSSPAVLNSKPPPPASARGNKSRPSSTMKSRPQSRAKSRQERPQSRAKSRAESRLSQFGEGVLTKEPSPALREIANLASHITTQIVNNSEYRLGLGEFFTAGVEAPVEEEVERTLTPTRNRPVSARRPKSALQGDGDTEKWKISNKLYSMTPRSWKPDFSLADTIPEAQAQQHIQDQGVQNLDRLAEESMLQHSARDNTEEVLASVDVGVKGLQAAIKMESNTNRNYSNSPRDKMPTRPKSKTGRNTPAQQSRPNTASGRESRMIVMEGEDLSLYDHLEETDDTVIDDNETLDQLEWELASESGRITAEGRISRMVDEMDTHEVEDSFDAGYKQISPRQPKERGFDIQNHLRESELMDDFEEMEAAIMDEEDVKRLV